MFATEEMPKDKIKFKNKKESILYRISSCILKVFLYLIPPYPKNK
jgi:hypothetical protein